MSDNHAAPVAVSAQTWRLISFLQAQTGMELGHFIKNILGIKMEHWHWHKIMLEKEGIKPEMIDHIEDLIQSSPKYVGMAEQQLVGFFHRAKGYSLSDLITSMGLTMGEWTVMQKRYGLEYLSEEAREEITAIIQADNV